MKNIWKRSLSMFLAFVMVFGMVPVNAFAVEEEFVEELLEEEIFEEEIVEEIFEEEVFEEIIEEEFVEELFEEEIVEETPTEEPQPVEVNLHTSDDVAAAAAEVVAGTYPIWLNDNKLISELVGIVADGESIRKNVLKAVVGEYGEEDKVYFSVAAEDLPEELQEKLGKVSDDLFATVFDEEEIIRVDQDNYDINVVAGEYFEAVQGLVAEALMDNHEAGLGYVVDFKVNGVVITIEFKGKLWKNITVEGTDDGAITVTAAEVLEESKWLAKVAESLTVTALDPMTGKTVTLDAADYLVVDEMGYEEPYLAPSFDPEKESVEEMKANGYLMLLVKVTDTEKFDLSYMEKDENGDYVLNEEGFPVISTEDFVFEVNAELVDSRAVCYDLYINADGAELVEGYYLKGTKAPDAPAKEDIPYAYVKNAQRDKQYYNLTWDKVVDEDDENVTTYGAVWTAILDDNQNIVADQEEKFTIMFSTSDLDEDKVHTNIPWGTPYTDYNGKSLIPDLSKISETKNFVRWDPFNPENETVKAPKNPAPETGTNTIIFTAVWTDNFTVKFQKADGTVDDALTQLIEDGNFVENPATEADPWVWDGYYVQSWVYAEAAGEHAAGDAFDFDTHAIETNIVLKPVGFVDRNENGKEDGVDESFYNFKWVVEGETVCETDWLPEKEGDKPTVEYYKDEVVVEKKIFDGWKTDDTDPYNIVYTAKFLEDKNENKVDDALEAYKFTKNDVAGEVYLLNGETKITEDAGIYDSTKSLTVVAVPVVEGGNSVTYVASITGAGEADYDDNFVATAAVTDAVKIAVTFESVAIESKGDTAWLDVHTDGSAYSDVDVYKAAISAPDYSDQMVVEYMARAKGTVTVNVGPLLTRIAEIDESVANKAKELFQKYYDTATGAYNYPLNCEEAWASLNETVDTTAQEVTEAYFNELMEREDRNSYLAGLYADGTLEETLKGEMTKRINNSDAGCHAFGEGIEEREGETGPMYIENLRVTYTDGEKFSVGTDSIELQIADYRPKTWIDVSAVETEFTYGDEIVPGVGAVVKATVGGEEIVVGYLDDMTASLTGTAAGEQYVTLKYDTNESYKGSEITYVVNVAKAKATITLEPSVVAIKGDDSYNTYKDRATPKSDAELIHVIAGMDLENANIKIEDGTFTLPDLKAWISLPQSVYDLVDAANKATDENGKPILEKKIILEDDDFYLSDLEEILETANVEGAQDILDAMKEVTSMLGDKQGNAEEMSIHVNFVKGDEEMFPEEIGAYVNAAVVYDSNYKTTTAKGVLVIAPAVALPNSGIDLVCGELNQHVYKFTLAEAAPLTVKQAPECPVQYYGFTYAGELYLSDEAPKSAGMYVASAIYENGENSGSDAAIILIASEEGSIELGSKNVTEDGTEQAPSVKNNGAYTLISLEADPSSKQVTAKVSVPEGAKKLLKKLGVEIVDGTTVGLEAFVNKLDAVKVKFDDVIDEIKPILEKIGVTEGIDETITNAQNQIQSYVDALKNELISLQEEYGNVLQIVFVSAEHNAYTKPGVYFYAAVVTDPDYLPAVDAGYLIIEDADFAVEDKTVTYEEGVKQNLLPTNDAGRGYITLIANADNSELNLILDGQYEKLVMDKLAAYGYVIDGATTTIGNLKEKADAEKIAEVIIDTINEQAAGRLKQLLTKVLRDEAKAERLYNKAMGVLNDKLAPMTQKIIDAITARITLGDDAKISVNGALPTEVGEYKFHYLSYAVAHGSATLTIEDPFWVTNIRMGTDLSMLFMFKPNDIYEYVDASEVRGLYAAVTHNGQTVEVPFGQWKWYENRSYIGIEYSGLAAKQMVDDITIQLYNANNEPVAPEFTSSLRKYAMNHLRNDDDQLFRVAMVDMLNYGTEAQLRFTYSTADLANAQMNASEKALASKAGTYTNAVQIVDENGYYEGAALRFNEKINMVMFFDYDGRLADTYTKFTWTDHYGEDQEITLNLSDYKKYTIDDVKYLGIEMDGLVVADARQMFTCTVYDVNTDEVVLTVDHSVESRCATEKEGDDDYDIDISFMKFADSAHKYLHAKES